MKRYIRTRFLIALAVLGALLGSGYVIVRLKIDPEAVRNRTIAQLSELLGAEVTVAHATFDPVLGFRIDDLTISTRDPEGRNKVLARAPRVKLMHCPMSLLNGQVRYRYISLREPQIYIERDASGRCNVEHLLDALRERRLAGTSVPTISLERAHCFYTDNSQADSKGGALSLELQNVTGAIEPANEGPEAFLLSLWVDDPEFGKWTVRNSRTDTEEGKLSFTAKSTPIEIDGKLRERFTGRARTVVERFQPRGGTVTLSARLDYDADADVPINWEVHANFKDTSASYARFPYEVTDLTGSLVFRRGCVELKELQGRRGPARVTFQGLVRGYQSGAPMDIRIEGKHVPLDARLRAAFDEKRRRDWDDFSPNGLVDLVCNLERKSTTQQRTRIRLLAKNSPGTTVSAKYRRFPYLMTLDGCVHYDAGVVKIVEQPSPGQKLEGLTPGALEARHGEAVVEVRGGMQPGEPKRLVHLEFRLHAGSDLPLDDDLKHALSPEMRQVWEYLDLAGSTKAACRLERTDPRQERLDVTVALTDIKSRIRCRDFPYEIRNPAGSVVYERNAKHYPNGRLLVQDLTAERGETTVDIFGDIAGFQAGRPIEKMDLTIRGTNLALNEELRRDVPERYASLWEYLSPTPESRVNVECRLERSRPDMERADFSLNIESIDGSLRCADFPYRVDGLCGVAEYCRNERFPDGRLQLEEIEGNGQHCKVSVSGVLAGFSANEKIDKIHLVIEGKEVPLDAKLRAALPTKYRKTFDAFHPEGIVDVVCVLKRSSRDEDLSAGLSIVPLGSSICYDRFPLRVSDLAGRISIVDGVVSVSKMRGRAAGGVVSLDGVVHRNGGKPKFDFTVTGKQMPLNGEVRSALPAKYREFWGKLQPQGKVTVSGTVKEVLTPLNGRAVEYSGVIMPQDTSFRLGLALSDLTGVIRLSGRSSNDVHDFRGRAELTNATVSGSTLKHLRASFEKHQNLFSIYELSGNLHGGELTAQVRMGLDDPISYGVVAQAKSLDLNDVLRRVLKTRTGDLEGLLSGRVLLQGQGTDPANLVGKAELTVHHGRLWEIPFVFRLLKMLNLSLPERTAFTDASTRFEFYDRSVHVRRLNLIGNAISIYGKGVVKPNREVAFSFETGWGRVRLPELPVISLVVKGLQQQIISVKMTGTLSDPKLEILPIVPLTAPVKGLVDAILASQEQAKERK